MTQDKIEIIIDKYPNGDELELDNLSLKATRVLINIMEAFTRIVEVENNPNIKIGLKSGSACFSIEDATGIYDNMLKVVRNEEDRDNKYVSNMIVVQEILNTSEFGFKAIMKKNDVEIPILNLFDNTFRLKRERKEIKHTFNIGFFKGKLYESGGKKPNFHIEQNNIKFRVNCSESHAIEVGKFLYKEVKISAWGKLNSNNKMVYDFCDIYNANQDDFYGDFKDFIKDNNSMSGTDPLKHIHYKLKSYYSQGKFKESRKFIKLFCNDTADVNRLRSILLISKPFKENNEIKDILKNVEDLIQCKIKRKVL